MRLKERKAGNPDVKAVEGRDLRDPLFGHLPGQAIPAIALTASDGQEINLAELSRGLLVLYVHPGFYPGRGWGLWAAEEAAQHSGYRELAGDFQSFGVRVASVTADAPQVRRHAAQRWGLSHHLLSDVNLNLAQALDLPTYDVTVGVHQHDRVTLVVQEGAIVNVQRSVLRPERDAGDALSWLLQQGLVFYQGEEVVPLRRRLGAAA